MEIFVRHVLPSDSGHSIYKESEAASYTSIRAWSRLRFNFSLLMTARRLETAVSEHPDIGILVQDWELRDPRLPDTLSSLVPWRPDFC
jgi:hypothetical protein